MNAKPHPLTVKKTELIWEGKYDAQGKRVAPLRVALPFQTVETINESIQDRQRNLLFGASASREREWRNRLVWGDKKYVLPSLLTEFAGKVNLIYIDPPFDTGADFSFTSNIPAAADGDEDSVAFTKEPSIIEQKAYRDTWGRDPDSYFQWFYETAVLLRELLAQTGSIYVHLDYRKAHYAKVILDEVFGTENFLNNVVWSYQTRHSTDRFWNRKHDDLLLYKKGDSWTFNWRDEDVIQKLSDNTIKKYKYTDEKGSYRLSGRFLKGSPIKGAKDVDPSWEKTHPELVVRDYLRPGMPPNDSFFIPIENQSSSDRTGYPTQKPTALLTKLIKASSNEGDLVLDCFVGSGTTAVVAEQLERRWISCDLGRFAIHTTRKRLLSIPDVKPFVIQNLGKYERQLWSAQQFDNGEDRIALESTQRAYTEFILRLYQANPIQGYTWLHGLKSGRMVHVGSVDAPVSTGDIPNIAAEFRRAVGTGKDAPSTNAVDILGWDFAFEMNEVARQQATAANIKMRFLRIPRDVMDKRAVEQGDIHFFELAALSVEAKAQKKKVTLRLTDFVIPPDDVPEEVSSSIRHWSQWIDYWAVDWDNKGDTFHNEWQTYRTRKDKTLSLETEHPYELAGDYRVVIKVIDILGNDTTKSIKVQIK
jgi:DNA modification methylase